MPYNFGADNFHTKKLCNRLSSAYMQNRLTNSLRYLVNAKPGTNHSTNPTNPNGGSAWKPHITTHRPHITRNQDIEPA